MTDIEWISLYIEYIKENQTENIDYYYVTPNNIELGCWVVSVLFQRIYKGILDDDCVALLKPLLNEHKPLYWSEWYELAKEYSSIAPIMSTTHKGKYCIGKWYFRQCRCINALSTDKLEKMLIIMPDNIKPIKYRMNKSLEQKSIIMSEDEKPSKQIHSYNINDLDWNMMYEYASKHYNDSHGKTIDNSLTIDNLPVGKWYYKQLQKARTLTISQRRKIYAILPHYMREKGFNEYKSLTECGSNSSLKYIKYGYDFEHWFDLKKTFDAIYEQYESLDSAFYLKSQIYSFPNFSMNNDVDEEEFNLTIRAKEKNYNTGKRVLKEILGNMYDLKETLQFFTCPFDEGYYGDFVDKSFDNEGFVFFISVKNITNRAINTEIVSFYIVHDNKSMNCDYNYAGYMDNKDRIEPDTIKSAGKIYFKKRFLIEIYKKMIT